MIEEKSQNRMACSDRLGKKRCDKLFHDNKCKGVSEDKMSYNCAKTCKKCSKLQNIMTCSDPSALTDWEVKDALLIPIMVCFVMDCIREK